MRQFVQYITLLGRVIDINNEINDDGANFGLKTRSGDIFYCYVNSSETRYYQVRNLNEANDERFNPSEDQTTPEGRRRRVEAVLSVGRLVQVEGTMLIDATKRRVDVRRVNLLYTDNTTTDPSKKSNLVFETNDWWVNQISDLADRWLFALFGANDDFDFNKYRTYLDINFEPKGTLQESATLSRLIYGLSSAYMLSGNVRYLRAAENGIKYQRDHFRTYKGDGCFWSYGRDVSKYNDIFPSQSGDDTNTIPLYEQIYAIAGLTQYYRITQDPEALKDISKTVYTFIKYFRDTSSYGGYFSHIDPFTLDYNCEKLGINRAKKNWNSVGDHIPAYLINLLIVVEPLAKSLNDSVLNEFLKHCEELLEETSRLIVEKFPDGDNPFVNERFHADWTPDHTYSWQQNRGIVGHNLKIAWNLLRVANYYETKTMKTKVDTSAMIQLAERLGTQMAEIGAIDLFRGGCYDALERVPTNGMKLDFAWLSTKDFWQQEQGILAYLILYGKTKNPMYLELAQEMSSFWNISFLDRKVGGVFFRTNENGQPIVEGDYGDKGGHAISGYHAFELCYLAHVYTCAYVTGERLRLHLRPKVTQENQVISVLPDFMNLPEVKLSTVRVNGMPRTLTTTETDGYFITLTPKDNDAIITVELGFTTQNYINQPTPPPVVMKGKIGIVIESHYEESSIRHFDEYFGQHGYKTEYITYLWGAKSVEYFGNDHCDPIRVTKDFKDINLTDYAGIILAAGYAQDRLRYEAQPHIEKGNRSPAVEFIRKAMVQPNLKVGIMCHAVWLLSVDPSLLKNRTLTCANNVIYDVVNASGKVITDANGTPVPVHVDENFISCQHPGLQKEFATKFLEEITKSYSQKAVAGH